MTVDRVLSSKRPQFSADGALEMAAASFGVNALTARDLGSERDQTFGLYEAFDRLVAVLKVSNAAEDPGVLDMEAAAALHITAADPELTVALPWRPLDTGHAGPARPGDGPVRLRAPWPLGRNVYWLRLYDALPGRSRIAASSLDQVALGAFGETAARLGRALRGFGHPQAHREMLWDVQHALATREMLAEIADPSARATVARILDEFERTAVPMWPRLRGQALHTDLTVDNTLTDERGFITGIIDFGDMSHTALVADLASVLDSLGTGRAGEDLVRMARLVLDGYQRRTELEDEELAVLPIAWAARSAVTIAISSWRAAQRLEEPAFAERYNAECLATITALEQIGWAELGHLLGAPETASQRSALRLAERRSEAFGPTMEPLFYDVPVQVVDGDGVWITETGGNRLLDAYNNVPAVGHGHPRVTSAIARQSRRVNTHMRYLHPAAIELAERLAALCPPELDTVLLVNSGSEANDLAWRMATAVTGRTGGLCTAFAYHGITEATANLSPEGWLDRSPPAHVATWAPPDVYRSAHLSPDEISDAIDRLTVRERAPAAAILDGLITSDGIADLHPVYVRGLLSRVRASGALWIADEVQAGHGRTGEAMWSFERFGIVPDFVTLGKPMGNGHPVAAVITRREIVDQLAGHTLLFSTFGGNPVSAAAALAVLDVIADERVLDRVQATGAALGGALRAVATGHPGVGDVRGIGLTWGVELVLDPDARTPAPVRARAVRDRMRHLGVLVGTTGPAANVLKIRPPLALTEAEIPVLTHALDTALNDTLTR